MWWWLTSRSPNQLLQGIPWTIQVAVKTSFNLFLFSIVEWCSKDPTAVINWQLSMYDHEQVTGTEVKVEMWRQGWIILAMGRLCFEYSLYLSETARRNVKVHRGKLGWKLDQKRVPSDMVFPDISWTKENFVVILSPSFLNPTVCREIRSA